MGFSRDKIRAEAKRQFKGLAIDDVPGGAVVLRSPLRLSDAEQSRLDSVEKRMNEFQEDSSKASLADVRALLIEQAMILAEPATEVFEEYLDEFDTAELMALFSLWKKETQANESKSGR